MKSPIKKSIPLRKLVGTAVLSALATVLMMLSFGLPFVPVFLKWDFSELPALLASFAYGPVYGVFVCLVKNLINAFFSSTMGIGELSNFLLGSMFVFISGIIYKKHHSFKGAVAGSLIGNTVMSFWGVFTNYCIIYPLFGIVLHYSSEAILGMYQAIYPGLTSMITALLLVNVPFTFVKGLFSVIITFLIYKRISPLLKGKK